MKYPFKGETNGEILTKGYIFGPTSYHVNSAEWQKHDSPYLHSCVVRKPASVDKVIAARICGHKLDSAFHETKSTMIHGLCGTLHDEWVLQLQVL